jgi:multisubunit Na+/H+ antiporter MnhG subunit
MTEPSPIEILSQANAMGLKLSDDGRSWVPKEELVVSVPPTRVMKTYHDSGLRISQLVIFTTIGILCMLGFMVGVFNAGFDNIISGSYLIVILFIALFLLTPIYFHLTRANENDGLQSVRIGQPIILNEQPLRQQQEERVMSTFGTIGLVFLLICIMSVIAAVFFFYLVLALLAEILNAL